MAPSVLAIVEVLLCDVFGTVVDWRTSMIDQLGALCRRHSLDLEPPELTDAWRAAYGPSMDRVLAGQTPYVNLDGLHERSLRALLGQRGIDPSHDVVEEMVRCWHRLEPWPDVPAGLGRLRSGYIVATMSNGNVALLVDLSKHAGLDWDVVLSAELAATYKKDPSSYTYCLELLGRSPEQSMMVSAHPVELSAVSELGMRTALVRRPFEHGVPRPIAVAPDREPDLVCDGFGELADLLGV